MVEMSDSIDNRDGRDVRSSSDLRQWRARAFESLSVVVLSLFARTLSTEYHDSLEQKDRRKKGRFFGENSGIDAKG